MIVVYISRHTPIDLSRFSDEFLEIHHLTSIESFLQFFESVKHRTVAMIYHIEEKDELFELVSLSFIDNIFLVIIGPSDTSIALAAGQIGADKYLGKDQIDEEQISALLIEGQKKLKKRRGASNVVVFTGIHGGAGTTTIALNSAVLLANRHLNHRVLFIDFSYTKGVANLFFEHPNPEKTIISLLNEEFSDFHGMLENGIYQYQNNLYYIPGIQLHTDREEFEKPESIQKMMQLINNAKRYFSHIIIDIGVFEDVNMAIDVQEIADSLFVVTELSIPSISILSTYLLITERSGWRPKTHIIVNRYDSHGAIAITEAQKLINKSTKKDYKITSILPNDWSILHEAWNNIELVGLTHPDSKFVKALENTLEQELVTEANIDDEGKSTGSYLGFKHLKRFFSWV